MKKQCFIFFLLFYFTVTAFAQQKPLPVIMVKNINGKIIISWINDYTKPITTLNIQRSYDSLRNYKTAGSVLSPQSRENGYADVNTPYNKMYYRIFVAFEGGTYAYSNIMRPIKDTTKYNNGADDKMPWMIGSGRDSGFIEPPAKPTITYPSSLIFTAKDNNVIIHLSETNNRKYSVKFFDETEKFLFEIKRVKEDYLIIEKVNFVHTGWFSFEIYEDGELLEKNKFQITKDPKKL
jgi:hypothetical protein